MTARTHRLRIAARVLHRLRYVAQVYEMAERFYPYEYQDWIYAEFVHAALHGKGRSRVAKHLTRRQRGTTEGR